MLDQSAASTSVDILFDGGGLYSIALDSSDFSFEGNPIKFGQVPVSKLEFDLNGNPMIRGQRTPIRVSLMLIPGSQGDTEFQKKLYAFRGGDYSGNVISQLIVHYPTNTRLEFLDGCLLDGMPGVGLRQDGRIDTGGTYNMEFAQYRYVYESVTSTNAYTVSPKQQDG